MVHLRGGGVCVSSQMKDCAQSSVCRSAHWTPHHFSTTHPTCPASACESYKVCFPFCCPATWSAGNFQTHHAGWFGMGSLLSGPRQERFSVPWGVGWISPFRSQNRRELLLGQPLLASLGCTYLRTSHQDLIWRMQQENNTQAPPHHLWGFPWPNLKTFSCLMIVNNIKGLMGNTTLRRYSTVCQLNIAQDCWTWSQIQYLYFGFFRLFNTLIVTSCFPQFCFQGQVHTGHRNLNKVLEQMSCVF